MDFVPELKTKKADIRSRQGRNIAHGPESKVVILKVGAGDPYLAFSASTAVSLHVAVSDCCSENRWGERGESRW